MGESDQSINIYEQDITGMRRKVVLGLVVDLLARLNNTDQGSIKDILYAGGEVDIFKQSISETQALLEKKNGRRATTLEGLQDAIAIAHFYMHEHVDLPQKVVVQKDEEDVASKIREANPEEKILVYFHFREYWGTKGKEISLKYPKRKKPLFGQEIIMTKPDLYIAQVELKSLFKQNKDSSLDVDGVENLLIAGYIGAKDSVTLNGSLRSEAVHILEGAKIGNQHDDIRIEAEGNIYQNEDTENHAVNISCHNYYHKGGVIELVSWQQRPGKKVTITCTGEFLEQSSTPVDFNEVEIVDKNQVDRQVRRQMGREIGDMGHDALPKDLVPGKQEKPKEKYPSLTERRTEFDELYHPIEEQMTQGYKEVVCGQIYEFDVSTPEGVMQYKRFLAHAASIYYKVENPTVLPSGKVLISLQRRIREEE